MDNEKGGGVQEIGGTGGLADAEGDKRDRVKRDRGEGTNGNATAMRGIGRGASRDYDD